MRRKVLHPQRLSLHRGAFKAGESLDAQVPQELHVGTGASEEAKPPALDLTLPEVNGIGVKELEQKFPGVAERFLRCCGLR